MNTKNFKMSFCKMDDYRYTHITFGFTEIYVYLYPVVPESFTLAGLSDRDDFLITYRNNGKVKLSVSTSDMPEFLRILVQRLYYGFFAYDKCSFSRSPALECISCIRSIQNYYKRIEKPFVSYVLETCNNSQS